MRHKQKKIPKLSIFLFSLNLILLISCIFLVPSLRNAGKEIFTSFIFQVILFVVVIIVILNPNTIFFLKNPRLLKKLSVANSHIEIKELDNSKDYLAGHYKSGMGIFIREYRVQNAEIYKVTPEDEIPYYLFDNKTGEFILFENIGRIINLKDSNEIYILHYSFFINRDKKYGNEFKTRDLFSVLTKPFAILMFGGNFIIRDFQKRLEKFNEGELTAIENEYVIPKLMKKVIVFQNENEKAEFLEVIRTVSSYHKIPISTD